jgi:secreted PhoX family phosphatase
MTTISRRQLLRRGAVAAGGAAVALSPASTLGHKQTKRRPIIGDLQEDPGGLLDLPPGFRYRVLSAEGELLSSGAPVPGDHDGMAAFRGRGGTTVLVRNHELTGTETPAVDGSNPYDSASPGGTTGIVVGPDRRELESFVTNSGTSTNCAGGATPWGTWITCEEIRIDGHGFVFEVDPRDPENELSRTPIRDMGFFSHEAVDIDPRSGIVYLTEDDFRGVIDPTDPSNDKRSSFLYRYLPNDRRPRPRALQRGGRLEALAIEEAPGQDADFFDSGQRFGIVWRAVNSEEPHDDALAKGCVRFNRLEGCHFAGGAFWFADTAGGEGRLGQIFRYLPGTETLELFLEATDSNDMESPDNVTIAPWGDLWFCEDGSGEDRVMGITPDGDTYQFANNSLNGSELAGITFAPDGHTAFVNIQSPGLTFAIWGGFGGHRHGRDRRLAAATPPTGLGPRVSPVLAEAAERHGLSRLEAAAYDRLGVALI